MTMHCGKSPMCTPKFYASHNFDGYQVHDAQKQRYYWIVLDGYKIGIYSLESAAESYLPNQGKFFLVRCHTITEAVLFWNDWCKQKHTLTCDPVKREKYRLEAVERSHPKPMPSSEDEMPLPGLSVPPRRRVVVLEGPGAQPDCGCPMSPVIFPLDERTAKKLKLKADGTRLLRGNSPGFKQEGPSRTKMASPSVRRRPARVSPSPSPEPKLPLFRDDDDDDDPHRAASSKPSASLTPAPSASIPLSTSVTSASSLSASTASVLSHYIQSELLSESASTAHGQVGRVVGRMSNEKPNPSKRSKFKPSTLAAHQVHERLSKSVALDERLSTKSSGPGQNSSKSGRKSLRGPFYFNPDRQTIYCNLNAGLRRMRDDDELAIVRSAAAMAAVVQAGGVLARREEVVDVLDDSDEEVREEEVAKALDMDML
ncbi:hypothetical protein MSAN_00297000 [Mycena sanguinolenta]|uniref:Uncharacterized protein n=1 Tax=Mycena sanguinolenta TaxID=230812 RepID=A0A8H6Z8A5_9AGAR|nr:hypothetical protein MSAN_00297000 [Mycena sanguinolenta]